MKRIETNNANDEGRIIYPELSYRVMKAVFEVHNLLGPGFVERIYERALAYELSSQGISFERQKEIVVRYKGQRVGVHRLDFLVDGKIILELKAVRALDDVFRLQVLSYLKATALRLGILVNFGTKRVEFVRIVNSPEVHSSYSSIRGIRDSYGGWG
ncbi:MAG TPA: GxxExxY protein [Chloroflexi bacterium]|nr:GxxExxY protein [Chloroflexota bacterium]